jgi:rubrerythrin
MMSLKESRTEDNLRRAFLDAALFDHRYSRCAHAARAAGFHALADQIRAVADGEACFANGHLDFVLAADCNASFDSQRNSAFDMTADLAAMRDERTAVYAGMARTAHEEGFEDIADWFETLAKAGRSHALRLRQALKNTS